ncbi:MAG: type IV secretory system conjugative DNA transfer family protein [Neisseriaceae bacterium]
MNILIFFAIAFVLPYLLFIYLKKQKIALISQGKYSIIQAPQASSEDEFFFAREASNSKLVNLTHQELNTHLFANGTTGSGKTIAFMNFVAEGCAKSLPLIYLDGKGSLDLVEQINYFAKKHNRVFRIFTIKPHAVDNPACYDFLGSGSFTERKNRIMKLFINASDAGAAYYQDRVDRFVNSVFRLIDIYQMNIDLFKFLKLVQNHDELIELASETDDKGLLDYFIWLKAQKKDSPRDRILDLLDVFINSSYGYLFDIKDKENFINLKRSILNNEIVLFLLDSSAYYTDTSKIAKMIISDINSVFAEFGEMRPKKFRKTFCIFDEFASYATDALSATISLHRSNGMHAIIGTQSITTVAEVSRETQRVAEELLSCCNTFLVLATTNDKDATRLAKIFGTKKRYDTNIHIKPEEQQVSSIINRQVEDFIVSPQEIKDIPVKSGIAYIYRKAVGQKPIKIQINKIE